MKNYRGSGRVVSLTAPAGDVVSGQPYLIDGILVIAVRSAAEGDAFDGEPKGVYEVTKVAEEAWGQGQAIYWDDTARKFTVESTDNRLAGVALPPEYTVSVALASDADPSDLLIVGLTAQVLDYAALSGATVTVTINGVANVLTEGEDFDAETSDDATATNLAAAIDALAAVAAAAVDDTVTVVPATGASAAGLATGLLRLDGATR